MKRLITRTFIALAVAAAATTIPANAQQKDIVDTAVAAGSFKTLAAALQAAGLVDTLKGTGPFTVFAPTDEAFAKLPAGTVENLLKPENKDQLTKVLTCHVVAAEAMAREALGAVGFFGGRGRQSPRFATARLLVAGADPNLADEAGMTPLDIAEEHGAHDVAALLLRYGARQGKDLAPPEA